MTPQQAVRGQRARIWWAGGVATVAIGLGAVQLAGLLSESVPQLAANDAPASSATLPSFEPTPTRGETYSNIYKFDYVGPETCAKCHAKNYQLWREHPHSKMNRNATAAEVVGNFSGATLDYGNGRALFSKQRGEFTMTLYHRDKALRQFKVTRTIGSRFVQMYIGIQSEGPEPKDDPVYGEEVKLPFAYGIERAQWFPQTYDENPGVPEYDEHGELTPFYAFYGHADKSWKRVCIKCHNTYPYALRFGAAPDNKLIGFPPADLSLAGTPLASVAAHGAHGGAGARLAGVESFDLVTLGISCESCHFGGREHAQSGAKMSFLPRSEDLVFASAKATEEASERPSAYAVNSICNQCHSAEPQGPIYPNGAASWNSREATDLTNGACASKISCIDCHNPHEKGPTSNEPERASHLEACTRCHSELRTAAAADAHSSHSAGVKVTCLDCHMPRIVHGLSGVIRSHRISSPTDPRMLGEDLPNACNLCHLDRSSRWTLDALASRWHATVTMPDGWPGSSPLAATGPLGPIWLRHELPVVRQVAAFAYGRSPMGKAALPQILPILNDDNPPTRMFGALAVEAILGRRLSLEEYAPWAAPALRQRQLEELQRRAAPPQP